MTPLKFNQAVVTALLRRFNITDGPSLLAALEPLSNALRASTANLALYGVPLEQMMPDNAGPEFVSQFISPYNVAAALHTLKFSAYRFGLPEPNLAPDLLLWDSTAWVQVAAQGLAYDQHPTLLFPPAPPAAAVPPPPPAAAAAPIIPPAPQPQPGVVGVDPNAALAAAMSALEQSAPAAAPATPFPGATVVSQPTPGGATVHSVPGALEPAPAAAPAATEAPRPAFQSNYAQHPSLPAVDVTAPRTSAAGRPAKSAFERAYNKRATFGAPPYWWKDFKASLPVLLTQPPPQAVDTESTAPTAVMAYTLALYSLRQMLLNVDSNVTVGALLAWIAEVDARITATPASDVAYDLIDNLFGKGVAPAE